MIPYADFELTQAQITKIKRQNQRKGIRQYIKQYGVEPDAETIQSFYTISDEDVEKWKMMYYSYATTEGVVPEDDTPAEEESGEPGYYVHIANRNAKTGAYEPIVVKMNHEVYDGQFELPMSDADAVEDGENIWWVKLNAVPNYATVHLKKDDDTSTSVNGTYFYIKKDAKINSPIYDIRIESPDTESTDGPFVFGENISLDYDQVFVLGAHNDKVETTIILKEHGQVFITTWNTITHRNTRDWESVVYTTPLYLHIANRTQDGKYSPIIVPVKGPAFYEDEDTLIEGDMTFGNLPNFQNIHYPSYYDEQTGTWSISYDDETGSWSHGAPTGTVSGPGTFMYLKEDKEIYSPALNVSFKDSDDGVTYVLEDTTSPVSSLTLTAKQTISALAGQYVGYQGYMSLDKNKKKGNIHFEAWDYMLNFKSYRASRVDNFDLLDE